MGVKCVKCAKSRLLFSESILVTVHYSCIFVCGFTVTLHLNQQPEMHAHSAAWVRLND